MTAHTIDAIRGFLGRAEAKRDEIAAELGTAEHAVHRLRAQLLNRLLADPRYAIPPGTDRFWADGYRSYLYQRAAEGGETFNEWWRSSLGRSSRSYGGDE